MARMIGGLLSVLLFGLSACAARPPMSADGPNLCSVVGRFAESGSPRYALFFWPAPAEDEIQFYAAMEAKPMDDAARALFAKLGQATHYWTLVQLKALLDRCPAVERGRVRLELSEAMCEGRSDACLRLTVASPR